MLKGIILYIGLHKLLKNPVCLNINALCFIVSIPFFINYFLYIYGNVFIQTVRHRGHIGFIAVH